MLNRTAGRITALAFSALALACESPAAPGSLDMLAAFAKSDNAPVHRASGGGTVDRPNGRLVYAFHGSLDGAGIASGTFELHFTSADVDVHGTVTCLSVSGNQAWLGGIVTRTSDTNLVPVGRQYQWTAIDNGEGSNAPPDIISGFAGGAVGGDWASRCGEQPPIGALGEWTNGNAQVR